MREGRTLLSPQQSSLLALWINENCVCCIRYPRLCLVAKNPNISARSFCIGRRVRAKGAWEARESRRALLLLYVSLDSCTVCISIKELSTNLLLLRRKP